MSSRAAVLLALFFVGACGGASEPMTPQPTTPAPTRPLAFITGGGAVDTIDAANRVRLTIKALDNSGAPLAGLPVTVLVRPAPSNLPFGGSPGSVAEPSLITDVEGLASTDLSFGTIVGTWFVVAQDMRRGTADSVSFTVKPGAPALVKTVPHDTLAFVGGGYQLAVSATDRRGNVVDAPVTYATDSVAGVASVTTAGRVAGLAVGRSRFVVRIAGSEILDTARVTIVPPGKLAAVSPEGLSVLNLDGSDFRTLVPGTGSYFFPSWSPDGTAVVYNSDSPATGVLFRVDLQGKITLLSTGATMPSETWPRYSPDGQFIYFSGGYYPDSIDTYRMRADGTGARVRVTPTRPGSTRYWKASPSPDGSLLAYSEAGFRLRVVNLVTGDDRIIPTSGWAEAPRFSPSGEWIAYADDFLHAMHVIRVDGSGHRVLTPSSLWVDYWGHDWSPDGEWIVFSRSGGLSLVRVSDGMILPLNYSRRLYAASWHQ